MKSSFGCSVRLIQVARSQRNTTAVGDGVRVLSDTRQPKRLFSEGAYKLSTELLSAGTVPQLGAHRCASRSKAAALEPIIARITAGQPYIHYMGYEANETRRSQKDTLFNTAVRTGAYPLQDWSWTRSECAQYIHRMTGRVWTKSACTYCPFALGSASGRSATLQRFGQEPDAGAHALLVERVSISLNERQALLGSDLLIDLVRRAGLSEVIERFEQQLAAAEHAVYEVRRLTKRHPTNAATAGLTARSVRKLHCGSAGEMHAALLSMPGRATVGADDITRMVVRARGEQLPRIANIGYCIREIGWTIGVAEHRSCHIYRATMLAQVALQWRCVGFPADGLMRHAPALVRRGYELQDDREGG